MIICYLYLCKQTIISDLADYYKSSKDIYKKGEGLTLFLLQIQGEGLTLLF